MHNRKHIVLLRYCTTVINFTSLVSGSTISHIPNVTHPRVSLRSRNFNRSMTVPFSTLLNYRTSRCLRVGKVFFLFRPRAAREIRWTANNSARIFSQHPWRNTLLDLASGKLLFPPTARDPPSRARERARSIDRVPNDGEYASRFREIAELSVKWRRMRNGTRLSRARGKIPSRRVRRHGKSKYIDASRCLSFLLSYQGDVPFLHDHFPSSRRDFLLLPIFERSIAGESQSGDVKPKRRARTWIRFAALATVTYRQAAENCIVTPSPAVSPAIRNLVFCICFCWIYITYTANVRRRFFARDRWSPFTRTDL